MFSFSEQKHGYNKYEVEAYIKRLASERDAEQLTLKNKNLNLEKQIREYEEQISVLLERKKELDFILESRDQIEEGYKKLYEYKMKKLDILIEQLTNILSSLTSKNPELNESVSEIKMVLDEFKQAIKKALEEEREHAHTAQKNDSDVIRTLLSRMKHTDEREETVSKSGKKTVIRRRKAHRVLPATQAEKSQIKPIANIKLDENEQFETLADKFLEEKEEPEEAAGIVKFLSKNLYGPDYAPNESGFDLKEAINPTDDLEEIMKAFKI